MAFYGEPYQRVNARGRRFDAAARDCALRAWTGLPIALGPGGFSALRVGMSAAKGLAMAAKLPVVGVATLDLEAFSYTGSGLNVCPMLDAGRGEVSTAYIGPDGTRKREDLICSPDEALDSVSEATLFCGEGVGRSFRAGPGAAGAAGGGGRVARTGGEGQRAGGDGAAAVGEGGAGRSGDAATLLFAYAEHRRAEATRPGGAEVIGLQQDKSCLVTTFVHWMASSPDSLSKPRV